MGGCRLTRPLGFNMSELPVDPRLARALVASTGSLACSQEVATIVALLGVQHVWGAGRGQRKALDAAKARCVGVRASAAGGEAGATDCWLSSTAEGISKVAVRGTVLNPSRPCSACLSTALLSQSCSLDKLDLRQGGAVHAALC